MVRDHYVEQITTGRRLSANMRSQHCTRAVLSIVLPVFAAVLVVLVTTADMRQFL